MAEANKTEQPKRKFINANVDEQLWREFRSVLTRMGADVTDGLEEAINEWLAING